MEETQQRIQACVDACEGIDTSALLSGYIQRIANLAETRKQNLEHEIEIHEITERQRDDLLTACEAFVSLAATNFVDWESEIIALEEVRILAQAAIAKARGEITLTGLSTSRPYPE